MRGGRRQRRVSAPAHCPGTKANGFTSVNLYSDDQGVAKQLPPNQVTALDTNRNRTGLAQNCGPSSGR